MTFSQQVSNLINKLKGDVQKIPSIVVEAVSKDMAQTAQRHFNTDLNDVGADDPYVVVSRSVNGNSAEVRCTGNQVLFIEFGAGAQNSFRNADNYLRLGAVKNWEGIKEQTTIVVQGRIIPAHGFKNYGLTEIAPRPTGIVPLGQYGHKRGQYDYWVRPTRTMVKKNREGYVHTANGIKNGVLWTMGTYPKRALWRARNSAIGKLLSGRLKLK